MVTTNRQQTVRINDARHHMLTDLVKGYGELMTLRVIRGCKRMVRLHVSHSYRLRRPRHRVQVVRLLLLLLVPVVLPIPGAVAIETETKTWDYVALGDSLAVGIGSSKSYVYRYAEMIEQDLGVDVRPVNFGSPGATSGDLLALIRTNQVLRDALGAAELVTWNIGGNDLSNARDRFKRGTCGGADNQDCLRAAEASFLANWKAIVAEIVALTDPNTTVLRTMTIYNPFVADDQADGSFEVFRPYLERINMHISIVAVANGAAYAQVYRAFNGPGGSEDPDPKGYIWFDGLHPSSDGHAVMAERLRELAYARSSEPANTAFARTWARTDAPVAARVVNRTWMWGASAYSAVMHEEYAGSPDGQRIVQYFDKSRMEINDPDGDLSSPWYVSNGLLVVELFSRQMQVGESEFINRSPAQVNVAGDPGDITAPTYAVMERLRDQPPAADEATIIQRIDAEAVITQDPSLSGYGVTAAERVTVTGIDHQVASVFWEFMLSSGPVLVRDELREERLFEDPFYATGLPITEAYWANVTVAGTPREVLIQCFERRCLTYTPDNPDGWRVEAGNVGQHYFVSRYGYIIQR